MTEVIFERLQMLHNKKSVRQLADAFNKENMENYNNVDGQT